MVATASPTNTQCRGSIAAPAMERSAAAHRRRYASSWASGSWPSSTGATAFSASGHFDPTRLLQDLFGRSHQVGRRILAAVVAELAGIDLELVEVDDRRLVLIREKSGEPHQDHAHGPLATIEELLAGHRRQVELLRRRGSGHHKRCRHK